MPEKSPATAPISSPWPHRLAMVLMCATFPLVWIGGLVTSSDAGMAVPDWPTTYGYNMFLYPWQTWVYGPWDLFIEHGHRLFASGVGLITIALVIVLWRYEPRRWVRYLGVVALAAVIFQGLLGGMRVIQNEVLLAKVHGCFGPAFFALTAALAVITSKRWRTADLNKVHPQAVRMQILAGSTAALAYLQLLLGSQLRHLSPGSSYETFQATLVFHLIVAAVLIVHAILLAWRTTALHRDERALWLPSLGILGLIAVQVLLGAAAYITNYGWPTWLQAAWNADYLVQAKGPAQIHSSTAHVAAGSLILATSVVITLRSVRLVRRPPVSLQLQTRAVNAAG
jgi:heme a synthase